MSRTDGLPPELYDSVYSFGVVHHTPHPGMLLVRTRHKISYDGITVVDLVRNWELRLRGIQTTQTRPRLDLRILGHRCQKGPNPLPPGPLRSLHPQVTFEQQRPTQLRYRAADPRPVGPPKCNMPLECRDWGVQPCVE